MNTINELNAGNMQILQLLICRKKQIDPVSSRAGKMDGVRC